MDFEVNRIVLVFYIALRADSSEKIKKVGIKMKKLLTVFLVALALFSFIGCDNSTPSPEDQLPAIPDKIEIPSATESLPQELAELSNLLHNNLIEYSSFTAVSNSYDKDGNLVLKTTTKMKGTRSTVIYEIGSKINGEDLSVIKANSTIRVEDSADAPEPEKVEMDGKKVPYAEVMSDILKLYSIVDKETAADKGVGELKIGEKTYSIVEEGVYNGEVSKYTTTITPAYEGITSFIVYDGYVVEIVGGEYNGVYNL